MSCIIESGWMEPSAISATGLKSSKIEYIWFTSYPLEALMKAGLLAYLDNVIMALISRSPAALTTVAIFWREG